MSDTSLRYAFTNLVAQDAPIRGRHPADMDGDQATAAGIKLGPHIVQAMDDRHRDALLGQVLAAVVLAVLVLAQVGVLVHLAAAGKLSSDVLPWINRIAVILVAVIGLLQGSLIFRWFTWRARVHHTQAIISRIHEVMPNRGLVIAGMETGFLDLIRIPRAEMARIQNVFRMRALVRLAIVVAVPWMVLLNLRDLVDLADLVLPAINPWFTALGGYVLTAIVGVCLAHSFLHQIVDHTLSIAYGRPGRRAPISL